MVGASVGKADGAAVGEAEGALVGAAVGGVVHALQCAGHVCRTVSGVHVRSCTMRRQLVGSGG